MKHIAAVAALILACVPLAADNVLNGVRSVYVAGNSLGIKRDITRALRSELPGVRVVNRAADADVVLEIRSDVPRTVRGNQPAVITVQTPVITSAKSTGGIQQNVQPVVIRNPEADQPSRQIGSAFGVAHRPHSSDQLIVYEGLPSPFFATQFAARFIRAWRDANP